VTPPVDSTTEQARGGSNRQRRQEQILAKAVLLFAQYGYGVDTQFLAEQLQVGKGTLYRYFSSKEELFLAAVDYGMRKLHEQLMAYIAGVEDPFEQIRQGVRAYLAFFAEHPEYVELLIQERALFKDRRKPTYLQHREDKVERWRDLYRSMMAQDCLRVMPAERISNVMSNLLYGTMCTNYFAYQKADFEAQTLEILDVMFFGILSDSERQARQTAGAGRG
jgi:AcrR family transcriptional regulator